MQNITGRELKKTLTTQATLPVLSVAFSGASKKTHSCHLVALEMLSLSEHAVGPVSFVCAWCRGQEEADLEVTDIKVTLFGSSSAAWSISFNSLLLGSL